MSTVLNTFSRKFSDPSCRAELSPETGSNDFVVVVFFFRTIMLIQEDLPRTPLNWDHMMVSIYIFVQLVS